MEASLGPLLPLYERERAAGNALALGVLVDTAGSTYRKAGACMLIASGGEFAGLLSGGCLEGDLGQHARSVIDTGTARIVRYDTRGPDDLLWGLGLGCEGAMQILLLRVGPREDWQPLAHLTQALASHSATAIGVVPETAEPTVPLGSFVLPEAPDAPPAPAPLRITAVQAALREAAHSARIAWIEGERASWRLFVLPLALPARVLLLGAGPDVAPLVDLAARLDWKVTLVDHRPAYAVPARFPAAERVVLASSAAELARALDPRPFDAVVVMTHHFPSDLAYLRVLAATRIPYVGLMGPVARREKLLTELGAAADALRPRLHAPIGLPLGGRSPEAVALAIVAEIQAFLHRSI